MVSYQPDPRFKFYITHVGKYILFTHRPVQFEQVDGVNVLIKDGCKQQLVDDLENLEVREFAERVEVSAGLVQRLRKGLGLVTPETGQSKTTLWRQREKGESDDA